MNAPGAGTRTVFLAAAAAAVGGAIQFYDGEYHPGAGGATAIGLITFAIVAAAAGVAWRHRCHPNPLPVLRERGQERVSGRRVSGLLGVLLAIQFAVLLAHRPDSPEHAYLFPRGLASLAYYHSGLAAAAALVGLGILAAFWGAQRGLAHLWFPASLVLFATLGWAVLHWTTRPGSDLDPHVDVFVFQQQGARALLHGRNPYAIRDYPDVYQSGTIDPATGRRRQEVYGPDMSDGRVLRFGFPYLPMSLYLATAGYAVAGDFRAAQLVALIVAAALIYSARPGPIAALAAALLLFTPRAFFILISGWTEPLLVLWMAASVYCACRRPALLPVALGLLLATKQYMALALPLTVLLVPRGKLDGSVEGDGGWRSLLPEWRRWLKLIGLTAVVAAAVTLPLALWNLERFYFSAVKVQRYAPFRWDALSYLTWYAFGHGPPSDRMTVLLPALASVLAMAFCLWRAARTPAGFAGSVGLVLLVFFAFSKQAFANYYFFVIGALCCAAAVTGAPSSSGNGPVEPAESAGPTE